MIVLAALFCLGVFVTVKELRYIFFGKLAQAQFVETYNETTRGKYGRKTNTPHVRYRFNDEAMVGIMVEDRLESLNNRATAACE